MQCMELGRKTKNFILIGANALFFGVKLVKELGYGFNLHPDELIWMVALVTFLLFSFLPFKSKSIQTIKYIYLFLLTSTAIGTSIAEVFKPKDYFFLEILWLPFGIAAAVFHYSSSSKNEWSPAYIRKPKAEPQETA